MQWTTGVIAAAYCWQLVLSRVALLFFQERRDEDRDERQRTESEIRRKEVFLELNLFLLMIDLCVEFLLVNDIACVFG